jgi:hypothetical protein
LYKVNIMLLRTILSIAALVLGSATARSQARETFDYAADATLEGLDAGIGWSAPWAVRKGNDQASIAEGNLAPVGVGQASSAPHLSVVHNAGDGGIRAARLLETPLTDDGQTYYLSWFQDSDYDDPANNGSVAQVILVNDLAYAATGPGGQLVRMGKLFGTENFGIDGVRGASGTIPGTDTREPMLVVVAIRFSGDEAADSLAFYINPSVTELSIDESSPDLTLGAQLNDGFDALGFKVEGGAGLNSMIDELRFGRTVSEALGGEILQLPGLNTDDFNGYAAGSTLNGLDGGIGWDTSWVTVSGDDPVITEGGLENFTLLKSTSGNRVAAEYTNTQGDSRYYRRLNAPFPDDGGTYYFSYSAQSTYTDVNRQADFFMFIDSENYGPGGPGGQLLQIGKPLDTPFIGAGFGGTGNFALTEALATEANLIVIKLVTTGNEEPDTVSLFLNPDVEGVEPASADAIKITDRLNNGFDAIGFKVTGLEPGNILDWDDVRAGLTYRSVLPQDFTDVTPPTGAFAIETFNTYTNGDTLGGLAGGSGWSGPWQAAPSSDMTTVEGTGLVNDALQAGTSGNSLRITADGTLERSVRYFEHPIDTAGNPEFWFSAHLGIAGADAGAVANLILLDTTYEADQRVIVGKPFPNTNIFAGGNGAVTGNQGSGRQFDGIGASFVVGRMSRVDGFWELDLYVNPDPAADTPARDSAQIVGKRYDAGNFQGIAVRIDGGGTELTFDLDDLYFGANYGEVVPADLTNTTPLPPGATELFDYDAGSDLIGQNGGSGWTGPWQSLSAEGETEIQSEGITALPLLRATPGPSVRLNSYLRAVRGLEGTYGDLGRTFWVGWWFDVDDGGPNVAHLVLADTATYAASGPEGQLAQIGKIFGQPTIGVVAAQGGNATGSDSEQGHFMVVRITTDGTPANDEIALWIDPDLDGAPSVDTADVVAGANLTNWNGIGFKFEGEESTTEARFDDVLVGFSFQDVIPGNLDDVDPPNTVRAAVEVFDYEAGQDLNGADGGEGWSGPWMAIAGSATIRDGNVDSPRTCPEGNSALLSQSGTDTPARYRRDFFNPFGTDEDSETFYFSFVLDGIAKDVGNSALVSLVSGENNILSIGGVPGLSSLAVIRNDESATPETTNLFNIGGTKWFVVRMDINSLTGIATAYVFLDPTADAIPIDETALFVIENVSIVDGITGIEVSGEGQQTVSLALDDIRAGTSYRQISCQFGSDDPDLLAYEPFNYDPNGSLVGAGGINAFWDGPWVLGADNDQNTAIVLDGSLDNPALDVEANRVQLSLLAEGEQLRIDRKLAFPLESEGETYWLSFLMNTTEGEAGNNVGNVVLRNSAISGSDGQRIVVGRLFGDRTLGTAIPGGATRKTDVVDEGQHWLVVRVQTNTVEEVDTVTFWIDPPATATAPDTTSAGFYQYFASPAFQDGIDVVRMRVEGAQGGQTPYITEFDEIAIATSWSSIVDLTNSVRNPTADPFAIGAFPNPFTRDLTVTYHLRDNGPVTVDLINLSGQVVLRRQMNDLFAGPQQLKFPPAATAGLSNGVYLLHVRQGKLHGTRKVVLNR